MVFLSTETPSQARDAQELNFCNEKVFRNSIHRVLLRKLLSPKSWLRFTFGQIWLVLAVWLLRSLHLALYEFFQLTDSISLLFIGLCFWTTDLHLLKNLVEGRLTLVPDEKGSIELKVVFASTVTSFRLFLILWGLWPIHVQFTPKYHLKRFYLTFSSFFFIYP